MRAKEILSEGLIDFIKRKSGFSWGKIGDVVRGSTVAEYLSHHTYHNTETLNHIKNSKYKLLNINPAQALEARKFTDDNSDSFEPTIDPFKMDNARYRNITPESLVKNPPVLDRDKFIWDGNHRIERALELKLPLIPVLMEI